MFFQNKVVRQAEKEMKKITHFYKQNPYFCRLNLMFFIVCSSASYEYFTNFNVKKMDTASLTRFMLKVTFIHMMFLLKDQKVEEIIEHYFESEGLMSQKREMLYVNILGSFAQKETMGKEWKNVLLKSQPVQQTLETLSQQLIYELNQSEALEERWNVLEREIQTMIMKRIEKNQRKFIKMFRQYEEKYHASYELFAIKSTG